MKQKPTFKSLLVVACTFSLFAFVFVNMQSGSGGNKAILQAPVVQTQAQLDEEEDNGRKIAVPDVTVLGRLLEIGQKLLDRKN